MLLSCLLQEILQQSGLQLGQQLGSFSAYGLAVDAYLGGLIHSAEVQQHTTAPGEILRQTDTEKAWVQLELASQALDEQRLPYAVQLLQDAGEACRNAPFCSEELERRRLLLLYRASPKQAAAIASQLGDEELLLRAEAALTEGDAARCAALLDSANVRDTESWIALRAECCFVQGQYSQAAAYFQKMEGRYLHRLEQCYEKLGDYKMAYHYACLQRKKDGEM